MKKELTRILGIALVAVMAISLFSGCTKKDDDQPLVSQGETDNEDTLTDVEPIKIGIIQPVEHQSLYDIYLGTIDELADNGYIDGENIIIDYQNAQGDSSNLKTISQRFVNNDTDLIIAIATGATQSVASETDTIPIVASSVTDLVGAGLVESNDSPGGNVTGVSDLTPIKEQIDVLISLTPNAKTIGVAYCSSEINSEIQAGMAKEYIESKGLICEITTIVNTNDIAQVLGIFATKVDALYIPVDNTFASAMPTVANICEENKLPIVVGAAAMVEEGALASIAYDYYDAGRQGAQMAIRILNGEDPAQMPVETINQTDLYLNKTFAESLDIIIPEELLSIAKEVY